jgi:hypothetical protein
MDAGGRRNVDPKRDIDAHQFDPDQLHGVITTSG